MAEVTQEMLQAAVTEAVKRKLLPKYVFLDDDYEKTWGAVSAVLQAALEVAPEAPIVYRDRYSRGCPHCDCSCIDCGACTSVA